MSLEYLQRLFDRSAAAAPPAAPPAQPAGISLSPVAEADQRLNDPVFAAGFGLFGGISAGTGEGSTETG